MFKGASLGDDAGEWFGVGAVASWVEKPVAVCMVFEL
jgi:hypothetical protein